MKSIILVLLICVFVSCQNKVETEDWQSLFNGKDLSGWTVKIKDHPIGENYKNTFRVEDSLLRVVYTDYPKFDLQFGHLYSQQSYSYYKVKLQYRFIGDHVADAPVWADRNSGIMLHSQPAESVNLHQNFPVSLEFQFLCGNGKDTVPTGNVCTPGTWLHFGDEPFLDHIKNSKSKTYLKNEWIQAEAEVYGDSLIRHIINGDTVLTYTKTRIGEGFVSPGNGWTWAGISDSAYWIGKANSILNEGVLALQAESQPIDFKNIYLLNLVGCMDKNAKNYKSYFVKENNSLCKY